ncbi:multiubiquitin domain-containing protein [Mesorhizobium sp. LNJC394B00]|uniref:multiubiquitin domain-containing protein n=1 Tax=Mesorhizobium sp. LNJC394B00 TaxID=1287274 RepID=UPI0009FCA3D4|nr:multiubiquitin domain-containing protein [Mesorhizobium sp. LNJC394B00]
MNDSDPIRSIHIAGTDLVFRAVPVNGQTPSGDQIALAAGFSSDDYSYVLQMRDNGELEDVRSRESVPLSDGQRFIVALSDRSYRLAFAGGPLDWPARFITAGTLRKLKGVAADKSIYLEKTAEPDFPLDEDDVIDLDEDGVESFKAGKLAGQRSRRCASSTWVNWKRCASRSSPVLLCSRSGTGPTRSSTSCATSVTCSRPRRTSGQ